MAVGARVEKPMLWVHVPKNAGTTMCTAAQQNGERIVRPSVNCNWQANDQSHLIGRGAVHINCSERLAKFTRDGFTWGGIEREINAQDLCMPAFEYGILLREPWDHMRSLLNCFVHLNATDIQHLFTCAANAKAGAHCSRPRIDYTSNRPNHVFFDNYLTRTLLGIDVYRLPMGAITGEHAQLAIRLLGAFSVVLLWDDLAQAKTVFRRAFGWAMSSGRAPQNKNPSRYVLTFTTEQGRLFRRLARHDFTIWEHFRSLTLEARVPERRANRSAPGVTR